MQNLTYKDLKYKYFMLFKKLPPSYIGLNQENKYYLKMLNESINNKTELDLELVYKFFEEKKQQREKEKEIIDNGIFKEQ